MNITKAKVIHLELLNDDVDLFESILRKIEKGNKQVGFIKVTKLTKDEYELLEEIKEKLNINNNEILEA